MAGRRLAALLAVSLIVGVAVLAYLQPDGGAIVVAGSPVKVTSGPTWLASLLYSPPPWAVKALGASVAALGVVLVLAWRRVEPDEELMYEMAGNAMTVGAMGGLALVLGQTDLLPYWATVLVASVVGFVLSMFAREALGL